MLKMKVLLRTIVFAAMLLPMSFEVFAPESHSLPVSYTSPLKPYQVLINAIGMVETGFDTLAYNAIEEAAGFFQIRPIRLLDYNRRTGSNYQMKDMFDYFIAEKIFLYYATGIGPYDFERIARSWNGSGPMTIEYWKKVKVFL
jgi:hypothetical protein